MTSTTITATALTFVGCRLPPPSSLANQPHVRWLPRPFSKKNSCRTSTCTCRRSKTLGSAPFTFGTHFLWRNQAEKMAKNEQEIAALEKFRAAISELDLAESKRRDVYLLRWLRAKDLNPSKAKDMLKKHLEYNKENDVANILSWEPPKSYHAEYFYEIVGPTPEGYPVLLIHWGRWDVRRAAETGRKDIWLKYAEIIFTKLEEAAKKNGVDGVIAVYNYDGYSARQVTSLGAIQLMVEFCRRCEANNPHLVKKIFMINTPKIFNTMLNFMKPVISKQAMEALKMFGHDKTEWQPAVLEVVPASILPVEFGGTIVRELPVHVPDPNEFITTSVKRGDKFLIDLDIELADTVLKWRYRTEAHDIGFEILFDGVMKVREYERVEASQEQVGELKCGQPGKYTLVFDNGHSKLRGKTLHYSISTVTPDA